MYERKSQLKIPDVEQFAAEYTVSGDVTSALLSCGVDEQHVDEIARIIYSRPAYRAVIDRADAHRSSPLPDVGVFQRDVAAMFLADIRAAYSNGAALAPDQLPWNVQMLIKSAKQNRNGQWEYTFIDRGAVVDKMARLLGAYEQPDGGVGEFRVLIEGKDAQL